MATPALAKMGLGVDLCDMSPVQAWLSASGLAAPAELPELKEVMFSGNEDICGKSFVGNKLFGSGRLVGWSSGQCPARASLEAHCRALGHRRRGRAVSAHARVTDARKGVGSPLCGWAARHTPRDELPAL